jgi:hypothetical protein
MARADEAMGMAKDAGAHRQKLHTSKRARDKFFFMKLLDTDPRKMNVARRESKPDSQ